MRISTSFRSLARLLAALVVSAAAGFVLLACSGCYSTMRKHPHFEEHRARIANMAVMPPDVEVVDEAFEGSGKRLGAFEDQARINLASIAARLLEEQGVAVRRVKPEEPALKESPELRLKLTHLQEAFAREMGEVYHREMMWHSKAFKAEHTLGPGAKVFAEWAKTDGLFFVRVRGVRDPRRNRSIDYPQTIAMAAVTETRPDPVLEEEAVVQVGLVDGATGDLIWSNIGWAEDLDGFWMEKTIEGMIKGMKPEEKKAKEKKPKNEKEEKK